MPEQALRLVNYPDEVIVGIKGEKFSFSANGKEISIPDIGVIHIINPHMGLVYFKRDSNVQGVRSEHYVTKDGPKDFLGGERFKIICLPEV